MDTQQLCHTVAEEFAVTGSETPPWPDPHPCANPAEEEYSRCLTPGKYRILSARAAAWIRALRQWGLAGEETVPAPSEAWRDEFTEPVETATRLRPHRTGAVPLLLGFASLDGVPAAIVTIGAGDPAVLLTSLPVCGCDACDDGSETLLDELDEHILAVVRGELVHVTTRHSTILDTGTRQDASGRKIPHDTDIDAIIAAARAGHSRHQVVTGVAWS